MKRQWLGLVLLMVTMNVRAENPPSSVKDFVGAHYQDLQGDLKVGDGTTVTALLARLRIPPIEKVATVKRLRGLSEAYPVPSEFAERVADLARPDLTPAASSSTVVTSITPLPAMNEADLVNLFIHLKYKSRIHLSMQNGDEVDAVFNSFDKTRKIIYAYPGDLGKKVYALKNMKSAAVLP